MKWAVLRVRVGLAVLASAFCSQHTTHVLQISQSSKQFIVGVQSTSLLPFYVKGKESAHRAQMQKQIRCTKLAKQIVQVHHERSWSETRSEVPNFQSVEFRELKMDHEGRRKVGLNASRIE